MSELVEATRRRHQPYPSRVLPTVVICRRCGENHEWPCDAIALASVVERLEGDIRGAHVALDEACKEADAEAAELRAERDAALARVAAVEALCDEWAAATVFAPYPATWLVQRVRAALAAPTVPGDGQEPGTTDAHAQVAAVEEVIAHAKRISPSPSMTVYVTDIERALDRDRPVAHKLGSSEGENQ